MVKGGLGLTAAAEQGGGATETEEKDATGFWNGADDALRVQGEGGDVPSFAGWIIGIGGGAGAAHHAVEVEVGSGAGAEGALHAAGQDATEGGPTNRIEFVPAVDGVAFVLQYTESTGASRFGGAFKAARE